MKLIQKLKTILSILLILITGGGFFPGIRDLMKRLEERSGVSHVHPHKFRRTFATNMARRGMPIQTIAKLMGHDKIETTMTYVMLYKEDVKHDYQHYYAS